MLLHKIQSKQVKHNDTSWSIWIDYSVVGTSSADSVAWTFSTVGNELAAESAHLILKSIIIVNAAGTNCETCA